MNRDGPTFRDATPQPLQGRGCKFTWPGRWKSAEPHHEEEHSSQDSTIQTTPGSGEDRVRRSRPHRSLDSGQTVKKSFCLSHSRTTTHKKLFQKRRGCEGGGRSAGWCRAGAFRLCYGCVQTCLVGGTGRILNAPAPLFPPTGVVVAVSELHSV